MNYILMQILIEYYNIRTILVSFKYMADVISKTII